jgi:hypothetical protein
MAPRRQRKPVQRLAAQSVELAWAAPQVVMHRLARMASAGGSPSARDRREFSRMGSEKVLAFYQSGAAFWVQLLRLQIQWSQSLMAMGWAMAFGVRPRASSRAASDAARLAAAALAPLHVTAVANARRLNARAGRTMRRP